MKRLLPGVLVLLALASCAPAFLEDLNRAAGLTDRMTLVGTVGAVSTGSDTNVRFYPVKPTASAISDVNVQSGFVVGDNGSSEDVHFAYNTSNGTQSIGGGGPPLNSPDPNYPAWEYEILTPASGTETVILVRAYPKTQIDRNVINAQAKCSIAT